MAPPSIWRSKDAQHFTLVHRSQRDPLIHDNDASSRVLAPSQRRQQRPRPPHNGAPISRSELEAEYKSTDRPNVGEAANYGVYLDDTEYDYMQHLRPIGGEYNSKRGGKDEEDDVDVVMLPGPTRQKEKGKAKAGGQLEFKEDADANKEALDLPQGALASSTEMDRDWARGTKEQGGLRPDMDPHLRQVLEALDDEAFLAGKRRQHQKDQQQPAASSSRSPADQSQDGAAEVDDFDEDDDGDLDDDFDDLFSQVIAGGEYDASQGAASEDENDWRQLPPEGDESLYLTPAEKAKKKREAGGELDLAEQVALFKEGLAPGISGPNDDAPRRGGKQKQQPGGSRRAPSSIGGSSIFGDGGSGKKSKPGSKARHAMSFYAPSAAGGSTAWSMSSSAMERNAGLRNVDDGFDRMEQIYEQEDEDGDGFDDDDDGFPPDDDDEGGDSGGGYIREDFETILEDFLHEKEVVGGKFRAILGGRDATAAEKLDIVRKEVGQARIDAWLNERQETQEEIDRDIEGRIRVVGGPPKNWDVETIQTTKTNVSNHPRVLSAAGGPSSISMAGSSSSRFGGSSSSNGTNGTLYSSAAGSSSSSSEFESIPKFRVNKRTGTTELIGWTRQRKVRAGQDPHDDADDEEDAVAVADKLKSLQVSLDDAAAADDDGSGPPPSPAPASDSDSDSDTETEDAYTQRRTIKRDRNESKQDKKQRKDAAKMEKQTRKAQKAKRKEEFANERKRQVKMDAGRIKDGGSADVRVGASKRLN